VADTLHPIVHFDPESMLSAALDNSQTTMTVREPTKFGSSQAAWLVDSEVIYASRVIPGSTIDIVRAQEGTTAAAHVAGSVLTAMTPTEEIKRIVAGSGLPLATPTLVNPTLSGVLKDTAGVNRLIQNAVAKTITDASATSLFEVPVTAGNYVGGLVLFAVFASDGTDHQCDIGTATYSAVNKAGTCTRTITYATANEAKAVSSGTLTLAFTLTDDTNKVTVKVQPTGSLTETTYTIFYTVMPLKGTVTIL
jgi:hypothetical protein